ncbi:hypothetical protein GCM10011501_00890 [Thalassotalea profundi]|uniref:DUF3465 domain-containing protein n=2 Tax=Thalassotalea profundi TaxID=2036687 RepID=A0ABQ3IFV8_9GAMM|nr:hypothetical protein GCM10011501_00890 [Thalassotalea profundi]
MKAFGIVNKIFPDDNKGSRHQKFTVMLKNKQTVLIVHNIDIGKKIPDLHIGDKIEFNGEYQWNSAGGMVHWTHHDPHGRHKDGWIRHKGQLYQ